MKDYEILKEFWDQNFKVSEEEIEELKNQISKDSDYLSLAPSAKLASTLDYFKGLDNVLDYGCGSGWASIILAKNGIKKVCAVDVSASSISLTNLYSSLFKVNDQVNSIVIDKDWLSKQSDSSSDGIFSSNVIDVLPLSMSKDIVKESARILKKDGIAIFSLNYYIDPNLMAKRGFEIKDNQIYIDGVLRLTSLKDSEWLEIFDEFFILIKLDYFAWPNEEKETRRIFVLKKK